MDGTQDASPDRAGAPPESTERAERFLPQLYGELRRLATHHMRRERRGHTLQTTALVNEAYLRMLARPEVECATCEQFLAIAAVTMRRILVDHARRHVARGGRVPRVSLADVDPAADPGETDFLAVDAALARLTRSNPRGGRIVELRFYGGLSIDEVSRELDVSPRTVDAEWREARDWLAGELRRATGS
jgi:RNA polymerase sigma factor (TIGR02999 family)